MSLIKMQHDVDPKVDILKRLGDLSDIEIFNNQILVAVYIRPEKTKGGIIMTDRARDEDKYQGKIGLIVKMGSDAFVDAEGKWFKNLEVNEGDWIIYRPAESWPMEVHGVTCRVLDDTAVRGRVKNPDNVW
jgi:co-chaperonin GroES (HSP10)